MKAEHRGGAHAQRAPDRFLSTIAGDLPGVEEATRALYRGDLRSFADRIQEWPREIREHALTLAHN
jgi:hypothetical protein